MRIVINHLTRMHAGHFCVGAVDTDAGRHIRPVLANSALSTDILSAPNNPFDMANVIELGTTRHSPQKPHVEDHVIELSRVRRLGVLTPDHFWGLLVVICRPTLREIFGPELNRIGRSSYGTDEGQGQASLGCLRPARKPTLHIATKASGGSQIRMTMTDGEIQADVSVTDIRLYQADHVTPDEQRVNGFAAAIRASESVVLSVGLTRAFASSEKYPPVHWLQVNNIHLKENPSWQLGRS